MRIVLLSVIALLINYAANGQTNRPIGGNAQDTALIQGSLRVNKNVTLDQYPNAVISTDANGKVVPLNTSDVLDLKTFDTAFRYSVSGEDPYLSTTHSTAVEGLTWLNDSNAILVYRDDTSNGHVSNSAVVYYKRLVNNVWTAPAVLYDSEYDDRNGLFQKTITGDTIISQIRRVQTSPIGEMGVYNAYSTDGGATISTYQLITSTPPSYIPYGIVAAEGKYYQIWQRSDTMRLYRSDNGLTDWTFISTVSQNAGAVEPSLVYAGNNTFIVLSRTQTPGINNLRQFVSTDLGASFSFLGFAPFGQVQPAMLYDAKRDLIIAFATQRMNNTVVGELQGHIPIYVGKPSEVITDTSKWKRIATMHRPIPNVKPFAGGGGLSMKNDSTFYFFITDAFQCDTGVIGDFCDKTSSYIATITYSDKMFSNLSDGISGLVAVDSIGNPYILHHEVPFSLTDDSSTIFSFDKPLISQQNPFNQYEKLLISMGANNTPNLIIYKDGRIDASAEVSFGSDVNIAGDIDGESSISTGAPPHIASNPDVRFGGVRDSSGTKQWGVRIGATNYWALVSTDGYFPFAKGSGNSTYLPMWDTDQVTLVNSSFRSQTGFNQSLQPLVISGFSSATNFQSQLFQLVNANGAMRFDNAVLNSEFGSNTGSNYTIRAYDDNGNFLYNALRVIRNTGNAYFYGALVTGKPTISVDAGVFKIGQVVLGTNGVDEYLEVEIDGQTGYIPFFSTKP